MKDGPKDYELCCFLTAESNGIVRPVHEKAISVILTNKEVVETWLSRPYEQAIKLQRLLQDSLTTIVPAPIPVEDVTAFGTRLSVLR